MARRLARSRARPFVPLRPRRHDLLLIFIISSSSCCCGVVGVGAPSPAALGPLFAERSSGVAAVAAAAASPPPPKPGARHQRRRRRQAALARGRRRRLPRPLLPAVGHRPNSGARGTTATGEAAAAEEQARGGCCGGAVVLPGQPAGQGSRSIRPRRPPLFARWGPAAERRWGHGGVCTRVGPGCAHVPLCRGGGAAARGGGSGPLELGGAPAGVGRPCHRTSVGEAAGSALNQGCPPQAPPLGECRPGVCLGCRNEAEP
eukprot:scaffold646_cov367-Prasinococcus_capsulatus_cf.AAC.11